MKIAIALLIGAAAAANVPHGRTVPESLKSVTPAKYGTCKHVACVHHKGNVHVFHTTNNGAGAHGPSTPHPSCKNAASKSAACKFGFPVGHKCTYNEASKQCKCTCWQVTPSPTPAPTKFPTPYPTPFPTPYPTPYPTKYPTKYPTPNPTRFPTPYPTRYPTPNPTRFPTRYPTRYPTPSRGSLKWSGWGRDGRPSKNAHCEGDCDSNSHCKSGCRCMHDLSTSQLNRYGCRGHSVSRYADYCVCP